MSTLPAAIAVARPVLFTVATYVLDEIQVTRGVISRLVPSEYVPVAVNCCNAPTVTLGLILVITIDDRVAAVAVSVRSPKYRPRPR